MLEASWDEKREEDFDVAANWCDCLARHIDPEPRYLSHRATAHHFELSMMLAVIPLLWEHEACVSIACRAMFSQHRRCDPTNMEIMERQDDWSNAGYRFNSPQARGLRDVYWKHWMKAIRSLFAGLPVILAASLSPALHANAAPAEVGVVVMHGKASAPGKAVSAVAAALEAEGFQVANLEMPWSGRREYDVDMAAAADEVSRALDAMRAKGARKLLVAGHSQGGLFAVHYGGLHKVDGIIAIAPGGGVDMAGFLRALGEDVAKARQMVAQGRGDEKSTFGDFEGRRGVTRVRTTAASYLSWFDPAGAHTSSAFGKVKDGTPVLYVAPTRDYPALARVRDANFSALPKHGGSRLLEVDADHMGAPSASAGPIRDWIRTVIDR